MIKKLTTEQLENLFQTRDPRKYTYFLNTLRNVGNPMLAVTMMEGYILDDDLLVILSYFFDGCEFYFEVSDENNLQEFYPIIKEKVLNTDEYLFSSDNEELYKSSTFISLFGEHSAELNEQYGFFKKLAPVPNADCIRLVDISDGEAVCNYVEPYYKWTDNLRNAYEAYIKNGNQNKNQKYKVYGYFSESNEILGYLISNTFDDKYWDIAHIHVTESARRQGIGTALAKYYAYDITSQLKFASYGHAANEASVNTALAAGFERFSALYKTSWEKTGKLCLKDSI